MKRYSLISLVVAVLLLGSFWTAEAGQPTIAGFEARSSEGKPGQGFSCYGLTNSGYSCDINELIAVFKENPGIDGAWQDTKTGDYVLMYQNNPVAFRGATFYALATGDRWRGGKRLDKIKVDRAIASTTITGEPVVLSFKNEYPDKHSYYQPMVFIVQFASSVYTKNGGRAWGGVPDFPNGEWIVRNKQNEVQVWVHVSNGTGKIEPPGELGRRLAKDLE